MSSAGREHGLYAVDAESGRMCLLPMAARRAFDVSGIHVSLAAWQALPEAERSRFVALGRAEQVDRDGVRSAVARLRMDAREQPEWVESSPDEIHAGVSAALASDRVLTRAMWRELRSLERYWLVKMAVRDRIDGVRGVYDELWPSHGKHETKEKPDERNG